MFNINKSLLISLMIMLSVFGYLGVALAFTEPPYIPVTKPAPTAIKTICASGCDYSTLEAADQAAQPGWLIKVKAGTYSPTTWDSSGTLGNEIVFEPFGDGDVIINCTGTNVFRVSGSYMIFDGGSDYEFIWEGQNMNGTYLYLFKPQSSSRNLTLSRLILRNATKNNCGGSGTNIHGRGDNLKVYNCEISGACDEGIYVVDGDNIEIRNNILYENDGSGIQANPHESGYRVDELIISGNAVYGNGFRNWSGDSVRPGMTIFSQSNLLDDVYIYNNLVWGNKRWGIQTGGGSNQRTRLFNNTLYGNIDGGFRIGVGSGSIAKNNICYNNGSSNWLDGEYLGPTEGGSSNNITTNPTFASTNENDDNFLKLRSTSTDAIDQGDDLSAVFMDDCFGNSRPKYDDYDIGAHEYTVEAPQNLTIKSID